MSERVHSVDVGPSVPGLAVRVALVLAVAVTVASGTIASPLLGAVAVVAALVGAAFPRTLAAWAAVACVPLGLLAAPPDVARTAAAVLAVYAIHVLATLSLVLGPLADVALSALIPSLVRLVVVEAVAQTLAAVVLLLVPHAAGTGFAWIAPGGAVAVLLLVVTLRARTPA